ncbi:hypothetical protein BCR35DRAFT_354501 [Leucosporidium creatinivorum]|uniref:Wax synthase domain-containing protein n=1 Tax=Leucosporidium creatinivorum TaxID=106004 RepID=A0A1Y2EGR8_9BASI|nr:hypothetical protein BCR35DRAFT_354501 [Leucosporidium creatinivorum]
MDRLAAQFGFEVTYYTPTPAPWHRLPSTAAAHGAVIAILAGWLYLAARMNKGPVRATMAWLGAAALLLWPSELGKGRSGLRMVDFGMPAWAFLATLNLIAIFFLRDVEEVHSWSFSRTICQLFAFPNEEVPPSSHPRLANVLALKLVFFKYIAVNLLLYAVPSPSIWASIKPYSLAYFFHGGITALTILNTLGFLIEGSLRIIGVIFGVEMLPLFNNPMAASNPREFWARWNLAIKDGLSRVFFHFKAPSARSLKRSSSASGQSSGRAPSSDRSGLRLRHFKNDYLSETEHSDSPSRASSPERLERKLIKKKLPPGSKRKPSPFLPKAMAAVLTFGASGVFHEYMNMIAFDGATGETLLFFLAQGAATVAYSWLRRTYPSLVEACPRWLGVVFVNIFAFETAPLFCGPFLREGWFEDLKGFGIAGSVKGFVWVVGDGHGAHAPQFVK